MAALFHSQTIKLGDYLFNSEIFYSAIRELNGIPIFIKRGIHFFKKEMFHTRKKGEKV